MITFSRICRLSALAGAVIAVAVVVTGCGTATRCDTAVTRSADGSFHAGSCPLDTTISVDVTAFPRTSEGVDAVVQHALRSADDTITHGGHLRVTAFGRVAARQLVVYDGNLPTLADQDEVQRGPTEDSTRAAISSALRSILHGAPHEGRLAKQVAALTAGGGSDVARALRLANASSGSRPHVSVVLTDGWAVDPAFDLASYVDSGRPTAAASRHLTVMAGGRAPGVAVVELTGLGESRRRFARHETPERTDRLRAVWEATCRALKPGRCSVNAEL